MGEAVRMDDFKKEKQKLEKEAKKKELTDTFKNRMKNDDTFRMAVISGGIALGLAIVKGALNIGRSAVITHRINSQAKVNRMKIYDPSARHNWYLKRELTNNEWMLIESRKASGDKLKDILDDLNVLK